LFPASEIHSVYAQTIVPDAYEYSDGELPLRARTPTILHAIRQAQETAPFADVSHPPQRPDLFIPGSTFTIRWIAKSSRVQASTNPVLPCRSSTPRW
jgi:hypothetical protein